MSCFRFVPADFAGGMRFCCPECCSQCKDVLPGIQTTEMATGMVDTVFFKVFFHIVFFRISNILDNQIALIAFELSPEIFMI